MKLISLFVCCQGFTYLQVSDFVSSFELDVLASGSEVDVHLQEMRGNNFCDPRFCSIDVSFCSERFKSSLILLLSYLVLLFFAAWSSCLACLSYCNLIGWADDDLCLLCFAVVRWLCLNGCRVLTRPFSAKNRYVPIS